MTTAEFIKTVGFHALGWGVSAEATYDLAMLALFRGIPGDFVECGVYAGASSAIMARAIMDYWSNRGLNPVEQRRVHLFDSFEGMPAAQPVDEEQWKAHKDATGMAAVSVQTVMANMERWGIPPELLVYHPGWFEQTVPLAAKSSDLLRRASNTGERGSIAVLRLDGDLYTSTAIPMQCFYPLVSPGGWVIVDDYHLSGCKKAVHETVNPGPVYWRKV